MEALKGIIEFRLRKYWYKYQQHKLKIKIIKYLKIDSKNNDQEKKEIIDYLKKNSLSVFPYNFTKKYNPNDVTVYTDNVCGLKYIIQDNKKLYFKKKWDENKIKNYYNSLRLEQDIDSPHRYEAGDFHVNEGDIVVDAGVAEGNFALSVVEKVKKIYLFDADDEWIEALKETFAPWKEKVEIICKYVSDNNDNKSIALDTVFEKRKIDFIKADIEGDEIALIKGCKNILLNTEKLKIVMCTYHNQDDSKKIKNELEDFGFTTEFSKGYMIFIYDKLSAPFLRKGIIRGQKM